MTNANHISGDPRKEALSNVPQAEQDHLSEIWDLVENTDESPRISNADIDQVWQTLSVTALSSQSVEPTAPTRTKLRLVSSRQTWMSIAATLLIGALGIGWWLQPVTMYAPEGQQLAVHLPDGSRIDLNSGSSIKYPRRFSDTRNVYLDGEAFFDISKSEVPFVLTTFNANVEVLGTAFNVKAWQNSIAPATSVSLAEGSIKFSTTQSPQNSVLLVPGETRYVPIGSDQISPADTVIQRYASAWQENDLVFRDQLLGVIIEDLERKFAIDINLRNEALLQKEFTFIYREAEASDAVLSSLCQGLGLNYSETSNGISIY